MKNRSFDLDIVLQDDRFINERNGKMFPSREEIQDTFFSTLLIFHRREILILLLSNEWNQKWNLVENDSNFYFWSQQVSIDATTVEEYRKLNRSDLSARKYEHDDVYPVSLKRNLCRAVDGQQLTSLWEIVNIDLHESYFPKILSYVSYTPTHTHTYSHKVARNKYAYFKRLFNFEDDRDLIRGAARIEESEGTVSSAFRCTRINRIPRSKVAATKTSQGLFPA